MFRLLAFAVLSHNAFVFAQISTVSPGARNYTVVMNSPAPTPSPSAAPATTAIQPTNTAVVHVTPTPSTAPVPTIEYSANITLHYPWNQNYTVNSSSEYIDMTEKIKTQVAKFLNSTGFTFKKCRNFVFMEYDGKVMAIFTIIASPLGDEVKPKDPTLRWKEEIEKNGMIGELIVRKESMKLKEIIPSGTTVKDWITRTDECEAKCGVGPVPQERECEGSGCNKVQKRRWVTCEKGGCVSGTGQNLMSSVPLVIAVLMMKLLV